MEPDLHAVSYRMTAGSEFFDTHRRAHRVFRSRKRADLFNPFRHIFWDSENSGDVEAGPRDSDTNIVQKGIFKCKRLVRGQPFNALNQFQRTILTSWINVLLICVPVGLCLSLVRGNSIDTFIVNYLAEIPLWFMCDYALEEMEKHIGRTASDLLDIFTSNTVQVISGVLLLKARKVALLQTSLVGGILSNILVLLGLSFLFGGVSNHEQRFNRIGAQGSSSLLSIAATSLLIPTAVKKLDQTTPENLVLQSRGVSVVLLFVYLTYTFCQMVTHRTDYGDSGKASQNATSHVHQDDPGPLNRFPDGHLPDSEARTERVVTLTGTQAALIAIEPIMRKSGCSLPMLIDSQKIPKPILPVQGTTEQGNTEIFGQQLHVGVATSVFVVSIVLLFFCINATVDSISALTEQRALSEAFVGLILLPIPNCDFAPISLAVDDYLEQTMKYTVGRSIQTALLVEPLMVLLAWWMGVSGVTLAFDGFEVVSLFTTILLLNFLVVDAKVHWIHGILLLADWVLIGIAAYFVTPEVST